MHFPVPTRGILFSATIGDIMERFMGSGMFDRLWKAFGWHIQKLFILADIRP